MYACMLWGIRNTPGTTRINIITHIRGRTIANIYPKICQPLSSVISKDFLTESKIPVFVNTAEKGANNNLAETYMPGSIKRIRPKKTANPVIKLMMRILKKKKRA